MQIRSVTVSDTPAWEAVSAAYDRFVLEQTGNLSEWYSGNDREPGFSDYMIAKINQGEAYMVVDDSDACLGVVGFSRKNNRISFFGIAPDADIRDVGSLLLDHALIQLDSNRPVRIHGFLSESFWIRDHRMLFEKHGFACKNRTRESGVFMQEFVREPPDC